ncbi:MAG: 50S ribosomal protein L24 [Oscillospiraceae bacterium]|nr:50S ribosomal protein L24 [Oscillospiraceae bacterium]
MQKRLHVKQGDTVKILSGDERGKKGKVLDVSPKEGKVIVEGRNIVKKHVKPKKMGDPGGIIEAAAAMYASKVQVVCPHCGDPARMGREENADGTKSRLCRRCKRTI